MICAVIGAAVFAFHNEKKTQMSFSEIPQYVFRRSGIDPQKPMVALTFDDGPERDVTGRILDTLEKYGAGATFFVLGENACEMEDILERQIQAGCLIGNHSFSHRRAGDIKDDEILSEFTKTDEIIKKISGDRAVIVRPPFGKDERKTAEITGRPVILWSLDTLDWESQDSEKIVNAVYSQVQDGDIILMHDIFPSTAEACERLVPGLLNRGFQLVTVTELMNARGIGLMSGKVYKDAKG